MIDLDALPNLNKDGYTPMYIQLSELLSQFINNNEIDLKTPLPSEKELMERYNISRTTARQALQRLEAADLVKRIRGKGTFLLDNSAKKHIGNLFQSIEERLAHHGLTVTNILLEQSTVIPPKNLAEELALAEGVNVCLIRRLKMIKDEPIGIEIRMIPLELADHFRKSDIKDEVFFKLINSLPDFSIHRISYSIESRIVSELEAEELKVPLATAVLVRKGIYYTKQGKPVMVSRMIFLTNHFDLEFIFEKEGKNWKVVKAV